MRLESDQRPRPTVSLPPMSMARLAEGVHADRAAEVAVALLDERNLDEETRSAAEQVVSTCDRITRDVATERRRLIDLLADDGIEAVPVVHEPAQRHGIRFRVSTAAQADRVADLLVADGYERWERWRAGAERSFHRNADHLTVGRTTDVTTVVRVSWGDRAPRGRVERAFRPTDGDWTMVTLPTWAWWGYPGVRVMRHVLERTGLRRRHESGLGPFLATPASLLGPLLRLADVGHGDTVVDLGCGDGRLAVAAATIAGAQSIGVETSEELVRRARERAAAAGVSDRVTIAAGDARDVDLTDADVVYAFLPADVLADVLPATLAAMAPGARLIAHEQHRLPAMVQPPPQRSTVLVGEDGLTVAHRWTA